MLRSAYENYMIEYMYMCIYSRIFKNVYLDNFIQKLEKIKSHEGYRQNGNDE